MTLEAGLSFKHEIFDHVHPLHLGVNDLKTPKNQTNQKTRSP